MDQVAHRVKTRYTNVSTVQLLCRKRRRCAHEDCPFLPKCFPLLEVFLLLEEHRKANDCAVDEQAANDAHNHRFHPDQIAMCEDDGQCCRRRC